MSATERAGPPDLTDDQRRAALMKAAEARQIRAEIKEQLKRGDLLLNDLLLRSDNEPVVGRLKVLSMLEAMPGTGKVRARHIMRDLDISERRRLKGLGRQQRAGLLAHFTNEKQPRDHD